MKNTLQIVSEMYLLGYKESEIVSALIKVDGMSKWLAELIYFGVKQYINLKNNF